MQQGMLMRSLNICDDNTCERFVELHGVKNTWYIET